MTFEYRKRITRQMLRAEPDTLFVFGDNMIARGLGGQAKEMRGEPNAVGIPTKSLPDMDESSFFRDHDLPHARPKIDNAFLKLAFHMLKGGKVVWPANGIGTGLAELPTRAPAIWQIIESGRTILASNPLAIPAKAEAEVGVREALEQEIVHWENDTRYLYPDNEVLESLDRIRAALANLPAKTERAVQLPCPVCGGEAIHAIDVLKRTTIADRGTVVREFHPNHNLPGCMMPDGGDCCAGYAALAEDWHRLRALAIK